MVKDLMDSEEIKVSAITKVFGCKEVQKLEYEVGLRRRMD